MNEWMTPQGILAICGLVTTIVLPLIVHLLTLAGKKDLAATIERVQDQARNAEVALASVIHGVQDAKRVLSPEAVTTLVEVLRARNQTTGAETTVKPIVQAAADGVSIPQAVREATTGRVPRRVS